MDNNEVSKKAGDIRTPKHLEEDRAQFKILYTAIEKEFIGNFNIVESSVTSLEISSWNILVSVRNSETHIEFYIVEDVSGIWHLRKSIIFHDVIYCDVIDELREILGAN
ncbi:MAG: hypothetical protein KAS32_13770 [Candidatus Peribacteraceae bacterium]|nr:hypothetical protein [Candidatus Peribacteraceae bacterium]